MANSLASCVTTSPYVAFVSEAFFQAEALLLIVSKSEIAACLLLNVFQSATVRYPFVVDEAAPSLDIIEAFVSSQVLVPVVFVSFVLSAEVRNRCVLHSVISSLVQERSSKLSGIFGMLFKSLKSFVLPTTDISASLAFKFNAAVTTLFSTGFVLVVDKLSSIGICLSVLSNNSQVAQLKK